MRTRKNIRYGTQQAFFYVDTYFLLPEGYSNESAFLYAVQHAKSAMTIRAVILQENNDAETVPYELGVCLAPYFIADYLSAPDTITIEYPQEIYPALVELLSQQEYNDRLRKQVMAFCPGCRSFGALTDDDSSLSGHFDEITLNGFCPYRWTSKRDPRIFFSSLNSFLHAWEECGYAKYSAADLLAEFKHHLNLSYTSGSIAEEAPGKTLTLFSRKPSLIQTALTDMISAFIPDDCGKEYCIRLEKRSEINASAVEALLSPEKIASTRKELGKYGVYLAVFEYAPQGINSIMFFLSIMVEMGHAWILHAEPGKTVCLLTAPSSLMHIRRASPMFETYNAAMTVYDPAKTTRYRINYDMRGNTPDPAQPL